MTDVAGWERVPDEDALPIVSMAISGFDYFSIPPDTGEVRSARERAGTVLTELHVHGIELMRRAGRVRSDGDD